MSVQVTSKCHGRRSAEGIEIFTVSSFLLDVDGYPVFTRVVRWIGVADQQTGIVRKSIRGEDAIETSHSTSNGAFYVLTIHAPKSYMTFLFLSISMTFSNYA